ncbi:unnamed protein product [Prunus armeniaca]
MPGMSNGDHSKHVLIVLEEGGQLIHAFCLASQDQGVLTQRHPQASNPFQGSLPGGFPHLDPSHLGSGVSRSALLCLAGQDQGVLTQRHPQASNPFQGNFPGGFPHLDPGSLIAIRRNLISLVRYFKDGTNTGLIYEYMDNRNLREHLSDNSWAGRLRLAMDAAHGLEYLHYCCKPPIIHRDVKSTNILLNENFQAKLSDFGLSRIFSAEDGTHECLDPDFGIVLLEIIISRPVSSMIHEELYICQWVSFMIEKGDVKIIVDPWLNGNFDSNSVWKAVEIALALAVELAWKNRDTESEDSIEMRPVKFTTEMRPLAR